MSKKKENVLESMELTPEEIYEKECLTEDVMTRLYSYLYILSILIESDKHSDECKINHMVILVDNMADEVKRMGKYYDLIKFFDEIEEKYSNLLNEDSDK